MPVPNAAILGRKYQIVQRLQAVLPAEAVIFEPVETRAYECDALTAYRCPPMVAVLPTSTEQVAAVLKICFEEGVPVVPRGSGTSLAGGALPTADCVILGVSRLNRVLETDYDNRFIRVQSGRTNLSVTGAVEEMDFFYAPRPVQPVGLRHRRKCRDELRWRPLPEIRRYHQQSVGRHHGVDGRHGDRTGRRASGCGRS